MSLEILTKHDLQSFKKELIEELKSIISNQTDANKKWLKSSEVRKLLKGLCPPEPLKKAIYRYIV